MITSTQVALQPHDAKLFYYSVRCHNFSCTFNQQCTLIYVLHEHVLTVKVFVQILEIVMRWHYKSWQRCSLCKAQSESSIHTTVDVLYFFLEPGYMYLVSKVVGYGSYFVISIGSKINSFKILLTILLDK